MIKKYKTIKIFVLFLLVFNVMPAFSAEQGADAAVTVDNPNIPVEDLGLLLKPLRKEQLLIETEAWFSLLEEKVREIGLKEIEVKNVNRDITKAIDGAKDKIDQIKNGDKAADAAGNQSTDELVVKEELNKNIAALKEKTEEIDQKTQEVSQAIADKAANGEGKEVRASEKEVIASAGEVEAAKAKLEETAESLEKADIKIEDKVQKVADAEVELHGKVKEHLLAQLNKLREEQTALVDRCSIVIQSLKGKGGEIDEYEKYIAAVSGIKVDVKDVSATKALIIGWLTSPEGGIRWGWNIICFVLIVVVFKILAVFLSSMTRHAMKIHKGSSDLLKEFFSNTVSKVTMIIGFVVALSMLGIDIGPLVAGIGAIGFIIGFALQGTLNNFAAGIMILMHRPYDVGDVVSAAGVTGVVASMNLNTTTVKTFDNQIVVVPNGSIWGGVITNVTGSSTRRVDMVFGISYSDDISKAQSILEDIVVSHELVLKDPEPVIRMHELADSSVNFVCRPWTNTSDYWKVYWDITRAVKERFDNNDISIPFPQRDVHIYQEMSAILPAAANQSSSDIPPAPENFDADELSGEN